MKESEYNFICIVSPKNDKPFKFKNVIVGQNIFNAMDAEKEKLLKVYPKGEFTLSGFVAAPTMDAEEIEVWEGELAKEEIFLQELEERGEFARKIQQIRKIKQIKGILARDIL